MYDKHEHKLNLCKTLIVIMKHLFKFLTLVRYLTTLGNNKGKTANSNCSSVFGKKEQSLGSGKRFLHFGQRTSFNCIVDSAIRSTMKMESVKTTDKK